MGTGTSDPTPLLEEVGTPTSGNPPILSDYTVREAGIRALEGDIGTSLERLTENRSLVKFWETLYRLGIPAIRLQDHI